MSRKVRENVNLSKPRRDFDSLIRWSDEVTSLLSFFMSQIAQRSNRAIPWDGTEPAVKLPMEAQSSDPADPPSGESVIWQSDGSDTGSDGDILMKITDTNGTTKTKTLVTF